MPEYSKQIRKWDCYIERINKSGLSNEEKSRAILCIDKIKSCGFDDEWLNDAVGESHPLTWEFVGYSIERTVQWIIDFASKLEALSAKQGCSELVRDHDSLINRIKDFQRCNDGSYGNVAGTLGEFEIASRLARNGYTIKLEPFKLGNNKKPKLGNNKSPDIQVDMQEGPLYIEIKTLIEQTRELESMKLQGCVFSKENELQVKIYGKLCQQLSNNQKQDLENELNKAASFAKQNNMPKEIIRYCIITSLITPHSYDQKLAEEWLSEHGLQSLAFTGPDWPIDKEYDRIKRKYGEDKDQLPHGSPGIKIVYAPPDAVPTAASGSPADLASRIEEKIKAQDNLVAGVAIWRYTSVKPIEDSTERHDNWVVMKQNFQYQAETDLLVYNPNTKFGQIQIENLLKKPGN
ncbi:MAG: hypothetical protein JRN10_08395 [Nitrososphaerota archaeon]|jgi:hypothetical protein|nr:hypothetical protein [Nitrososphaerota archaeon]MDG6931237.1 hypothetical protein [Nitrososphaerota archaeon]